MNLQYPIGKFICPKVITKQHIVDWIEGIEKLPQKIIELVEDFNEELLETPYRIGGWTARQVVHHIYDSHHNGYIRFKWALTEDRPSIKAYYEDRWAQLFDTKSGPIHLSLNSIETLHAKWVYLLKGLTDKDLQRVFVHPEGNIEISLAEDIGIYAWHGNHHLAHLKIISGAIA